MQPESYVVKKNAKYGYRCLDPIPTPQQLEEFFRKQNYELIRKGERTNELRRLMSAGSEADREREWLETTLYADVLHVLERFAPGRRCLDVGCGNGALLSFLKKNGCEVKGIEPGVEGAAGACAAGLDVLALDFDQYADTVHARNPEQFDAIIFIGVLQHFPDPSAVLKRVCSMLAPGGIVAIRTGNDFSELQIAAQEKIGCRPWWVVVPDQINYFNFESLSKLITGAGLEVVYSQGDFPMEFFLLFGENYIGNHEIGAACHRKRISFELSIAPDLRRRIYRSLASQGVGRCCLSIGKMPSR